MKTEQLDHLDELILDAARAADRGDADLRQARDRLARGLLPWAGRFFRRQGAGGQDVEDLQQDLAIKVLAVAEGSLPIDRPSAWLATVARNLWIDRHRQWSRRSKVRVMGEKAEDALEAAVDTAGCSRPDEITAVRAAAGALDVYAERAGARRHQVTAWVRLRICGETAADVSASMVARGDVSAASAETVWKWAQRTPALLEQLASADEDPARRDRVREILRAG